jgi:membrane protein insertase Oxa1/YidC/SpoIIIJ
MSWASGLAIYFVVTNLVSIIIQYFVNKYTTLGHKKPRKRG